MREQLVPTHVLHRLVPAVVPVLGQLVCHPRERQQLLQVLLTSTTTGSYRAHAMRGRSDFSAAAFRDCGGKSASTLERPDAVWPGRSTPRGRDGEVRRASGLRLEDRPQRALKTGLTYLGPEADLSALRINLTLGVLFRVGGDGGSSALFSWGLGFGL